LEVVVHTAGGSDVIAGLIGGAVVLLSVILAEALVRRREHQRRLETATWAFLSTSHLLAAGNIDDLTRREIQSELAAFGRGLGPVRVEARWPTHNAAAIANELDQINARLMVAVTRWSAGTHGAPRLGPITGERLSGLVFRNRLTSKERINDALRAEGLPTLDELDPHDDAINAPLPAPAAKPEFRS
jgi:hypothetical protein